jgi:hypothetical protein
MAISFVLVGMVNYKELNVPNALAYGMFRVGNPHSLLFLQLQKEQGFGVDWSHLWIKPFSLAGLPSG